MSCQDMYGFENYEILKTFLIKKMDLYIFDYSGLEFLSYHKSGLLISLKPNEEYIKIEVSNINKIIRNKDELILAYHSFYWNVYHKNKQSYSKQFSFTNYTFWYTRSKEGAFRYFRKTFENNSIDHIKK